MHNERRVTPEWQLAHLRQALELLRRAKHHAERQAAIRAVQQQLAALEAAYRRTTLQPGENTRSGMKRAA